MTRRREPRPGTHQPGADRLDTRHPGVDMMLGISARVAGKPISGLTADRHHLDVDEFNPDARRASLWTQAQLTPESQQYLQALAQSGQPMAGAPPQDGDTITDGDLNDMLDAIRNMAQSGARNAARREQPARCRWRARRYRRISAARWQGSGRVRRA